MKAAADFAFADIFDKLSGTPAARQARAGPPARRCRLGERCLEIRLAGETLAESLLPALSHLAEAGDEAPPDQFLSLTVMECPTVPVKLSPRQWQGITTTGVIGPHDFVYAEADLLMAVKGGQAILCHRDARGIPPWEIAMPFRIVLNAWFQRFGGQIVHGAAVADDAEAVILAGRGGAGKSSTALSCLRGDGLFWLADDLCLLGGGERPVVHSLYNSIKLKHDNQSHYHDLPLPGPTHLPCAEDKSTYFLHPGHRRKLALRRPVKAILLPRIGARARTDIVPASPADAWRALVPSTLAVVPGDRRIAVGLMSGMLERLPAFWLELGSDRAAIPRVIGEFLRAPLRGQSAS